MESLGSIFVLELYFNRYLYKQIPKTPASKSASAANFEMQLLFGNTD